MVKTEIKVRPELLNDANAFVSHLEKLVGKINNDYGRNLSLHSWLVDVKEDDEILNVKTVEISLK